MESKYDSYLEREVVYKVSFEEFSKALEDEDYMSNELILALIRNYKDSIQIYADVTPQSDIMVFSGVCFTGSKKIKSNCRFDFVDDPMYNPLNEYDSLRNDHWYHPYKIQFTSTEFLTTNTRMYFSDFCSLVREGHIELRIID